jgi:hypothetical protein
MFFNSGHECEVSAPLNGHFYTPKVLLIFISVMGGPGSVVGKATTYGLDGPGMESRFGARFSAPVQTGPEIHPAFCEIGTVSFPGVRCSRGETLTSHPLLEPWSKKE